MLQSCSTHCVPVHTIFSDIEHISRSQYNQTVVQSSDLYLYCCPYKTFFIGYGFNFMWGVKYIELLMHIYTAFTGFPSLNVESFWAFDLVLYLFLSLLLNWKCLSSTSAFSLNIIDRKQNKYTAIQCKYVVCSQDEKRRKRFFAGERPPIELGAVYDTTCRNCGGHGKEQTILCC